MDIDFYLNINGITPLDVIKKHLPTLTDDEIRCGVQRWLDVHARRDVDVAIVENFDNYIRNRAGNHPTETFQNDLKEIHLQDYYGLSREEEAYIRKERERGALSIAVELRKSYARVKAIVGEDDDYDQIRRFHRSSLQR